MDCRSLVEKMAAMFVATSNMTPAAVVHSHAKPRLYLNRVDRKLFEDFMREVKNAIDHFPLLYTPLSYLDQQTLTHYSVQGLYYERHRLIEC
jgi:hypothetical protein